MGCQPSKVEVTVVEEFNPVIGPDTKTTTTTVLRRTDFHEIFELRAKLGEGAHGTVYSASGPAGGDSDRAVAVKVVDLRGPGSDLERARQRLSVAKEASVLGALPKSACVVEFHGAYLTAGCAYFVMEKCEMGLWPAFQRMPAWTEEAFRPILRDMMSGIAVCHNAGVVHRDVKFDNFLAVLGEAGHLIPKLCDFGLSGRVSNPEAKELCGVCGTPPFLAPEVFGEERYNAKVDVWAMGALAHALLFGRWPYMPSPMTARAMKAAIFAGNPAPSFEPDSGMPAVSTSCSGWVRALLRRCPTSRPSAKAALLDDGLSAMWSCSGSLASPLASAWRCGAFETPLKEGALTDLDRYVARLNSARDMARTPTRAGSSSFLTASESSASASTGTWQAAQWSAAD